MAEAHEELHELEEHAEHAQHVASLAPVSLTMAVLAVLVAVTTLLGHRAHTEEVLLQAKVTDQWGYYQARVSRIISHEKLLDELTVLPMANPQKAKELQAKYEAALKREQDRQKEIQDEARRLENEVAVEQHRGDRFDLAEGLLEAALVITSITLLTRKRFFWYFGTALAVVGLVVASTAFRFHL